MPSTITPGARVFPPPTRRQLAQTVERIIPAVNTQIENTEQMRADLTRLARDLHAFQHMTRWQRLHWVLAL